MVLEAGVEIASFSSDHDSKLGTQDLLSDFSRPSQVRRPTVAREAFYVVLTVTPERRREVLDIFHMPTESATGCGILMDRLAERGLCQVDLIVADGIAGLGSELARRFSAARVQRCVVHIKRQLIARVRPSDKAAMAGDLVGVFRIDDPHDSIEAGWQRWGAMCRTHTSTDCLTIWITCTPSPTRTSTRACDR
jgi:transposase-like protein